MEGFSGPAWPSPTIAQCLDGRYSWLEVQCKRCETRARLPLHARRANERPRLVKLRRTHHEHMSSASPPNSDIALCSRHFAFVPGRDIPSGLISVIRSPRRRVRAASATLSPSAPMTRSLCGVERLPSPKLANFLSTPKAIMTSSGRTFIVLKGVPALEGFTANMNYCLVMEETGKKKGGFVRDSASISTAIRSGHRPSISFFKGSGWPQPRHCGARQLCKAKAAGIFALRLPGSKIDCL
jgi:hypothetical protein